MNGKGPRDRSRGMEIRTISDNLDKIFKRRDLVLLSCECARLCLQYVEYDRTQPLDAIKAAEAWARGEATIEEVKAAAIKSAHLAVWVAYSAFSATPYSAYNAAYTVYADDPLDSAQRAIDSACFANRKKTLRKCEKIAKKYRIKIDYEPIRLRRVK